MAQAQVDDRRRYLRYPPDETEVVLLQFSNTTPSEEVFEPETAGLVCEESRGGLRVVVLTRGPIRSVEKGARCVIQVANLGLQAAEIRWMDAIDDDVVKLGLEFS
ncbi:MULTISPECIES: hypothetical protein [unclassified Wenzhouxiangella]|uniref:hypothetical protein n=1 Tax=unclassified Wenzhouxiangella TaxID=2613841 RepID=UPI000E329FC6|nr:MULTISPECIES: hypothetical protein [unclassified Wenzhouxiangella]RFF27823.1 hypothetical protein DZK25_05975 [Wenzhouxiangella sp. 15181]RFP70333.1 hypothetical protein DZK26_00225 [Wenzhouxiangella sp. 15190]